MFMSDKKFLSKKFQWGSFYNNVYFLINNMNCTIMYSVYNCTLPLFFIDKDFNVEKWLKLVY